MRPRFNPLESGIWNLEIGDWRLIITKNKMQLDVIGLAIIAMAWIIQFMYMKKKDPGVQPLVIFTYVTGVLLLAIDGYMDGVTNIIAFNLISAAAALTVLMRINALKRGK